MIHYVLLIFMVLTNGPTLVAQVLLPIGIGTYGVGYRMYGVQSNYFDNDGVKRSLGAKYSQDFHGNSLLNGAGGEELKTLATQLKKFDGNDESANSLLNTLRLGRVAFDVQGKVNATSLGLAYGFTKHFTAFLLVPWVNAATNVEVTYIDDNNIDVIRKRMGDLAFEELKSGFDRAQQINSRQILDSATALGYGEIGPWSNSGIGDISIGSNLGFTNRLNTNTTLNHTLTSTVTLPTGYYDDPDLLNDTSIGLGYFSLSNTYYPTVSINEVWHLAGQIGVTLGMPTQVEKRVPERNESMVDIGRTRSVNLQPGLDIYYSGKVSYSPWFLQPSWRIGAIRHTRDTYSGSLNGNYEALSIDSETYKLYHEPSITLDTTKLYAKKQFAIPLIANFTVHVPLAGKNSIADPYYEFQLASFFATPAASKELPKTESPRKRQLKRKLQPRNASDRSYY